MSVKNYGSKGASEVVVKSPPAKAGDARDMNSIPGSGRSPEEGNGNSSILAWETRWTEEPVRLQSMRPQSDMSE